MKVYTVTVFYDYEGSKLDSIWLGFEAAKARAIELLTSGPDQQALPLLQPYEDTAVSFSCRSESGHAGDGVHVREVEVRG